MRDQPRSSAVSVLTVEERGARSRFGIFSCAPRLVAQACSVCAVSRWPEAWARVCKFFAFSLLLCHSLKGYSRLVFRFTHLDLFGLEGERKVRHSMSFFSNKISLSSSAENHGWNGIVLRTRTVEHGGALRGEIKSYLARLSGSSHQRKQTAGKGSERHRLRPLELHPSEYSALSPSICDRMNRGTYFVKQTCWMDCQVQTSSTHNFQFTVRCLALVAFPTTPERFQIVAPNQNTSLR